MLPFGTCHIGSGHWTLGNDGRVLHWHAVARMTLNEEALTVADGSARQQEPEPYYDRVDAAEGDVLCASGEPLNALFLIRSGEVELLGRRRRQVLGPGQVFGDVGFGRLSGSAWTARALTDAALLRIDGENLERRLQDRRGCESLQLQGITGWDDRPAFEG